MLQRAVVDGWDGMQGLALQHPPVLQLQGPAAQAVWPQILDALENDPNPYRILFGDFNAAASEFAQLRGYTVVNTADTLFYNYAGALLAKNEIDNIVVSDTSPCSTRAWLETGSSDHRPLIAYLVLR